MLYITSLVLITEILYLLNTLIQSPLPTPPPLVTTNPVPFSMSLFLNYN